MPCPRNLMCGNAQSPVAADGSSPVAHGFPVLPRNTQMWGRTLECQPQPLIGLPPSVRAQSFDHGGDRDGAFCSFATRR
jgi:hypothetical protein